MAHLIFGHKNPDTDSVTSAIALSYLKNQLGYETKPFILGAINKESEFILETFNVNVPDILENVYVQVKDLKFDKMSGISPNKSILWAYKEMTSKNIKTLAITDLQGIILGLITLNVIATELIRGNFYVLDTSVKNILDDFDGTLLTGDREKICGKIMVLAYNFDSIKGTLDENTIAIVGDRYDVIDHAINSKVQLIIVTGAGHIPDKYLVDAKKNNICVISVPTDTYTTSKLINQSNYISTVMKTTDLVLFTSNNYLQEVKEQLLNTTYRNYPILDDDGKFIGFIGRRHILAPRRKEVILVDHNEINQSAEGIEEAEIIEIIDHHKIGDIKTNMPISFRNLPVGSTCTIVYNMFKEFKIEIPYNIAGLLASGIISDTLLLKSPTTTELDEIAIKELVSLLKIDIESYSIKMFKTGTALENLSLEEIFYKDFKEFKMDNNTFGISQVFTMDTENIISRSEAFVKYVIELHDNRGYFLTALLLTDILNEGSYIFFKSKNNRLVSLAFEVDAVNGVFAPGIVSRKKQVIPRILNSMQYLT